MKKSNIDNAAFKNFQIKKSEFLPYNIKDTELLNVKQKIANYQDADYCIVTYRKTLPLLLMELRPLFERGGVFYKIYNKINSVEDLDKPANEFEK
jgi:hypothetical protein